jgi:hypothetical protein
MRGFLKFVCIALFVAACGDDGNLNQLPDAPVGQLDPDGDGVPNAMDNCPDVSNANQVNTDGDAQGDACDDDDDNDTIADANDNCALVANLDQANADGDAEGDACDGDTDGDTIANPNDNCPLAANTDQLNTDGDTEGDACDADDDNDTLLDMLDNCSVVANTQQENNDGDATGDACDADDDNDTVDDVNDNCALVANTDQLNSDTDPLGNACDDDDDDDTLLDAADNCPIDANMDQVDTDTDTAGDACDTDDDNDSVLDTNDNCVTVPNSDQSDTDDDTLGNSCDPDADNDTLPNGGDNCPGISNAGQEDGDGDGIGDACDTLVPQVNELIVGGNIVAAGRSWSGREDSVADTSVDIVIAGIPANAQIRNAFLYWTVIGTPFPTVTFNGTTLQGAEIGQTQDTCWGIGNNFMYRANVTALVAGNGTFTLTNILSNNSGSGPDGQGSSLVVIYSDPADTRTNLVTISDGAIGYVGGGPSTIITTFPATLDAAPDLVRAFNVVADGQGFPETLTYNGTELGAGNPFFGADGNLWDTRVDDVSTVVTVGASQIDTTVSSFSDCLAWSANAIVVEKFSGTVQPLKPKAKLKLKLPTKTAPALAGKPQRKPLRNTHGRMP